MGSTEHARCGTHPAEAGEPSSDEEGEDKPKQPKHAKNVDKAADGKRAPSFDVVDADPEDDDGGEEGAGKGGAELDEPEIGEDDFEGDEAVTLSSTAVAPVDQQAIASRLEAPDVVAVEEEARRNGVDAETQDSSVSNNVHVPATVDPAIANMTAVIKNVGQVWQWWQVDMSRCEHGVVHADVPPVQATWAMVQNFGSRRHEGQLKFWAVGENSNRMMSQAIIVPIEMPDAPEDSKPHKMLMIPIEVNDWSSGVAPKAAQLSQCNCTMMLPIQAEVVSKMFYVDKVSSSLPSSLHPDNVNYVSFNTSEEFIKIAKAQPGWSQFTTPTRPGKVGGKRGASGSGSGSGDRKSVV